MIDVITPTNWILIQFIYGLAFFSMGFAILLEGGRASDLRLRLALRPLMGFGIMNGLAQWLDMADHMNILSQDPEFLLAWHSVKLSILAFSYLSLAAFGFSALAPDIRIRRISLLAPLIMALIWGMALFSLQGDFPTVADLDKAAGVLTGYLLGIPSAMVASLGLVAQQRAFRKEGLARFGRDSLLAAIAFAWYGIFGQIFPSRSRLFPSMYVNDELFYVWFRFPIELLQATLAVFVAFFVIRFLRSFDAEIEREIQNLQEAQLREAQRREHLRGQLLQRVVNAQEAERKRVARELHDETGQMLTAIGMGLKSLRRGLPEAGEKAEKTLSEMDKLVTSSLEEVHRIVRNLRPSQLDDLGLQAALRWYVGEMQEHAAPLRIYLAVEGESYELPSAVKTTAFRIVQEAVTNTIKHAQASKVEITVTYQNGSVELEICDDGIGFNMRKVDQFEGKSFGLLGIRERVNLLQGSFEVHAQADEGVRLFVRIPLSASDFTEEDDDE